MYKKAMPLFIHVQTPLHVGTGSDLGIVDQPIQREKHTAYPKIEGSGIKGCFKEVFENIEDVKPNEVDLLFGPEEAGDNSHAAALAFSDARLLLFPVRSVKGVFVWITCPQVLTRFKKDLQICAAFNQSGTNSLVSSFFQNTQYVPQANTAANPEKIRVTEEAGSQIILEEYAFTVEENPHTKNFARALANTLGIDELNDKLVVLKDDVFKDFVQLFTEVVTRTKIDNATGTVDQGALFTEEYLPAESVLYTLNLISPIFTEESKKGNFKSENENKLDETQKIANFFVENLPEYVQMGGNATLGKGIVKVVTC